MIKQLLIVFYILLFFSCHGSFDNLVDPNSDKFIGYEAVVGKTTVELLTCKSGEEVLVPELSWTNIPSSQYYLQVSSSEYFEDDSIVYINIFNTSTLFTSSKYEFNGWPNSCDKVLENLKSGKYFWRVSVKNIYTKNEFKSWSNIGSFVIKFKRISSGWEDNSVKVYYSYLNDSDTERESTYVISSSNNVHIESIVRSYDEKHNLTKIENFSTADCNPSKKTKSTGIIYFKENKGELNYIIAKSLVTENGLTYIESYKIESYKNEKLENISTFFVKDKNSSLDLKNVEEIITSNNYYKKEERLYYYKNEFQNETDVFYYNYYKDEDKQIVDFLGHYTLDEGKIIKYENFKINPVDNGFVKTLTYSWTMLYMPFGKNLHKEAHYYYPRYSLSGENNIIEYEKTKIYFYKYN